MNSNVCTPPETRMTTTSGNGGRCKGEVGNETTLSRGPYLGDGSTVIDIYISVRLRVIPSWFVVTKKILADGIVINIIRHVLRSDPDHLAPDAITGWTTPGKTEAMILIMKCLDRAPLSDRVRFTLVIIKLEQSGCLTCCSTTLTVLRRCCIHTTRFHTICSKL
mgnify:CR=1 FL=1